MSIDSSPLFKGLLVGAKSCGKSSLLMRMTSDRFDTAIPAYGSLVQEVALRDSCGKRLRCRIWDTFNLESITPKVGTLPSAFFSQLRLLFLVFDLNDPKSAEYILQWVQRKLQRVAAQAQEIADEPLAVLIVGTKADTTAVPNTPALIIARRCLTSTPPEGVEVWPQVLRVSSKSGSGLAQMREVCGTLLEQVSETVAVEGKAKTGKKKACQVF
eukprot:gnl/Dysnectes_brevis/7227_a11924_352.p1 GENE.gnl/Dysnectes_brevis/7227_a11924_352~~gnl/Dysnectes_brevis/7227_a11924_352.p1  ORF type:complete len:214 (-),score=35.42 gnl/Dysnectes_brevis/7227_a11924_352:394-1035(-)